MIKKFFSQKLSWVGIGCFLMAVICMVMQSVTTPGEKLVTKMGSAVANKDVQKFVECFPEEDREDAAMEFESIFFDEAMIKFEQMYGGASAQSTTNTKIERVILQGESRENEDGSISVPMTLVTFMNGEITGQSDSTVVIFEDETSGTKYIR